MTNNKCSQKLYNILHLKSLELKLNLMVVKERRKEPAVPLIGGRDGSIRWSTMTCTEVLCNK